MSMQAQEPLYDIFGLRPDFFPCLQAAHIWQCAQFPPQEDFPCCLSLIRDRTMPATIIMSKSVIKIVPIFAAIHSNIICSFILLF